MNKFEKDNIVTCKITGIEKYGIFVDLDDYYKGLIHISEISKNYVNDINKYVKIGDTIKAKVIETDEKNCHVRLTIKDIKYKEDMIDDNPIKEVGSGFNILKNNLSKWVSSKIQEKNKEN